jgi:hypothetical protein
VGAHTPQALPYAEVIQYTQVGQDAAQLQARLYV